MRFPCTIKKLTDGNWSVRHVGRELESFEVKAASRDEACEKMRSEIRYRLELCPCTGESYQHVQIELVEG